MRISRNVPDVVCSNRRNTTAAPRVRNVYFIIISNTAVLTVYREYEKCATKNVEREQLL
jgi:hypothetical protein